MSAQIGDNRFTNGLIYDVIKVLEQHGYKLPSDDLQTSALGRSVGVLLELVETYEGRCDSSVILSPNNKFGPEPVRQHQLKA
ncbi:hypothetical protein AB0O34_36630 [Sphaerisporangium sp. NPDC088356]|uniref:hypothetical protein n=1 Tax=Sphaerisporangium sp. NPDC088356 TaxID=3154871 RepID=UPI003414D2E7